MGNHTTNRLFTSRDEFVVRQAKLGVSCGVQVPAG